MIVRESNSGLHGVVGFMTCHGGKAGYKAVISSQYSEAGGKSTVDHCSFDSLAAIPDAGPVKTSDIFQCTLSKWHLNIGQRVPNHGGSLTPVS